MHKVQPNRHTFTFVDEVYVNTKRIGSIIRNKVYNLLDYFYIMLDALLCLRRIQ